MPQPRAGMSVVRTPAARLAVAVLVVLALVAIWLIVSGRDSTAGVGSTPGARSSATSSYGQPGSSGGAGGGSGGQATPRSDLPAIAESRLNAQAAHTLALIRSGGPYPYRQDGVVFTNREGHLPRQRSGYYHEFTVVTPGSPDRGARRIIAGAGGDLYYTDDHYASFRQIGEGT